MRSYSRRRFLKIGSTSAIAVMLRRSALAPRNGSTSFVEALWSGALTPTSVRINAKIDHESSQVRAIVSPNSDLSNGILSAPIAADFLANNQMVGLDVGGLSPGTRYHYGIDSDGLLDDTNRGQFTTPGVGPFSFRLAFGSCADTFSTHAVFDTIRALNPLFFLHLGDMHYLDIAVNDPEEFQIAYELVLSSPAQSTLYRSAPIAYMWDDHDYGPNNSNSTAAGRQAARQTYQGYVPHYPLPAGSGNVPIYQSFVIGRVRFILSDLRSERSPQSDPEGPAKTMMGATQKAWFKDELLAGRDAQKLIVWAGTVPWIGPAVANGDHWAGYTTERQELANFIGDNQVHNLVMLSGDAHMIALDGGSNSGYASGGGGGFPVMHAAALDRSGSTKGGPYSHGSYPGRGQFGTMDIYDDGGAEVSYLLRGYDAGLNQIVSYAKGNRVLLPLIRKD